MTKTFSKMIAALALVTLVGCDGSPEASASPAEPTAKALSRPGPQGAQAWQGSGAMFDRQGKKLADYKLKMTRRPLADGKLHSVIEIQLGPDKTKRITCTITPDRSGKTESWRVDCGDRRGGGHCFGEGLCLDHVVDDAGTAHATTVVLDGADGMRLMRTELVKGKAVRFFRERLSRVAR